MFPQLQRNQKLFHLIAFKIHTYTLAHLVYIYNSTHRQYVFVLVKYYIFSYVIGFELHSDTNHTEPQIFSYTHTHTCALVLKTFVIHMFLYIIQNSFMYVRVCAFAKLNPAHILQIKRAVTANCN